MKGQITINGQNGAFGAYLARPKALPAPAVVVLQELFGVNADIRKTCDELAEQGFIAVAPDLFWRQEPGVDLSVNSEADWQHGLRLYQAYNRDAGAEDVRDTAEGVAKLPECTGNVAVLGYCLGALMTFLTAVRYAVVYMARYAFSSKSSTISSTPAPPNPLSGLAPGCFPLFAPGRGRNPSPTDSWHTLATPPSAAPSLRHGPYGLRGQTRRPESHQILIMIVRDAAEHVAHEAAPCDELAQDDPNRTPVVRKSSR